MATRDVALDSTATSDNNNKKRKCIHWHEVAVATCTGRFFCIFSGAVHMVQVPDLLWEKHRLPQTQAGCVGTGGLANLSGVWELLNRVTFALLTSVGLQDVYWDRLRSSERHFSSFWIETKNIFFSQCWRVCALFESFGICTEGRGVRGTPPHALLEMRLEKPQ